QQRLPELDRCVPAARLDQPWLPPDQSGEIDELVELVGAGRGGATAPTILDSRGCFPHGSVRGGPVPSIPLAITSLRVVLRSWPARSCSCFRIHSSRLIMRATLSCWARIARASRVCACTSASVPTVFGSFNTVSDWASVVSPTLSRIPYVPGGTRGPRSIRSRSHVTSGRVPSDPTRTNGLPGGGVRSLGTAAGAERRSHH